MSKQDWKKQSQSPWRQSSESVYVLVLSLTDRSICMQLMSAFLLLDSVAHFFSTFAFLWKQIHSVNSFSHLLSLRWCINIIMHLSLLHCCFCWTAAVALFVHFVAVLWVCATLQTSLAISDSEYSKALSLATGTHYKYNKTNTLLILLLLLHQLWTNSVVVSSPQQTPNLLEFMQPVDWVSFCRSYR